MSARTLLVVLGLMGALGLAGWAARRDRPFRPAWDARPPNLLFVSVDTLRADHMGIYGYGRATTPEIDAWAEGAVVFDDAQASSSWTLPGLATIWTSYFSSTTRCWTFASRLDPSFPTLAEVLRDAGYDTMAVTSHIFLARRYGLQQGFVHFDDEFAHPVGNPHTQITSPMVSDKGIRFLEEKAAARNAGVDDVPWMLWLHYFDPHGVYQEHEGISEEFGTRKELDLYDGEVRFTDLHVGRVLDRLVELGFEQDTVVVFFSDHGEEFDDHGGKRHGHTLHRELMRVPLVIKAEGLAPRRIAETVRTVDLLPTVLGFVPGVEPPEGIEGVSFFPALSGGPLRQLPALGELKLDEAATFDCIRKDRWKLIVSIDGEAELYDVERDPLEIHDVAQDHSEVVDELGELLGRMITKARRRGEDFEGSGELGLTPSQMEHLRGLGYIGE